MGAGKKKALKHHTQTPKTAKRVRNMTPRIGASGAEWSSARAPGLDRPGLNSEPRTGASEATERYDKKTPRIGASGAEWSAAQAPGLDRSGENPVPRSGASEATERIRKKEAPDWSNRGGMKHGTSPRTGSSRG